MKHGVMRAWIGVALAASVLACADDGAAPVAGSDATSATTAATSTTGTATGQLTATTDSPATDDDGSTTGPPVPFDCDPTRYRADPEALRVALSEFSGATPAGFDGGPQTIDERGSATGRALARDWLAQRYTAAGYTVTEHDYGTGTNIVADKPGADASTVLIIGAHLDSVGNAGADDNGTGIISSLAMAEAFADCELAFDLRFVAFDEEEQGLVGSQAYVAQLAADGETDRIRGLVNMETLGYDNDDDGTMLLVDCDMPGSTDLTQLVVDVIARDGLALTRTAGCSPASDHGPFWDAGVPAIAVSQDFFGPGADRNPCYHAGCDDVDQINFDYFAEITTAVGRAVAGEIIVP